ncbi:MAG: GNAT family N-acetyltransferase [Lachnospiraceae bacterium]|nr:GNAT family N-acetyltransferase [Lachnospiraceae bacterium]
MPFVKVTEQNIADAGRIHSESWKESHRSFCSAEFVEKHTPAAQADYLRREIAAGKQIYMLILEYPAGIVSVHGALIENLYVLPAEQRKGYGTQLLKFAIRHCAGNPSLWILNNNESAYRLYIRNGFKETGNKKKLNGQLSEMELAWCGKK